MNGAEEGLTVFFSHLPIRVHIHEELRLLEATLTIYKFKISLSRDIPVYFSLSLFQVSI